jgi:putative colanic acid biosynthesis acetyltransferase WcaF
MASRVRLSEFDNSWYDPGRNDLVRVLWLLVSALFVQSALQPSSAIRVKLLRLFGARIGEGVVIKPRVQVKYPWRLEVGDHVWIGEGAWIDNLANVTIDSNVCISQEVYLLTGNHDYRAPTFDLKVEKICLKEGAWVGARAVVCPGVTMAEDSVLAVGSVLSSDTEAATIYRGNPAIPTSKRYPGSPPETAT